MKQKTAYFRFYEELNDYLPAEKKKRLFEYLFTGSRSVRQAIADLGVPSAEADLVLVNGHSVDFSYRLKQEDRISVFPVLDRKSVV
jgi:uncharacterized protein